MKDDPITDCPDCSGAVKRLLYPVGIVFKGSGWYINDSRKPDTSESAPPAPADSKNGESKSAETKTDSKTDSKTETKSDSKTDSKSESPPAAAASTR
jgi:predicted nucleic acid-binding Zn ribbon protein